jgi:cytochrome b561
MINRPRYSFASKVLHWLVALGVLALIVIGVTMKFFLPEGAFRDQLYTLHEAIGACVLMAMALRLASRLIFGVPAPLATIGPIERRGSLTAQYALYALLFIVPILGWAGTNAYGDPVSVFGLFSFPVIMGKDEALSDRIFTFHLIGAITIAAIATLHIGAALYHYLIKRDRLIHRMLPEGK